MDKTDEQKIELLNKAIDAIIEAAAETELDYHYFVNAEKSVVARLRHEIFCIEEKTKIPI